MEFFWSEFSSVEDKLAKPKKDTWDNFVEGLYFREIKSVEEKALVNLWSPSRYKSGQTRGLAGIEALSAQVFDFDNVSENYLHSLQEKLKGYTYVLQSSAQHLSPGNSFRFRVVLPMAGEATRKEWETTRFFLIEELGIVPGLEDKKAGITLVEGYDPKANNAATLFFWPTRLENSPHFLNIHNDGRFLEVERNKKAPKLSSVEIPVPNVSADFFIGIPGKSCDFIRRWEQSEKGSEAFDLFVKYKNGEPIAQVTSRDSTLTSDMLVVANRMNIQQLHETDEQVIVNFMEASIEATPYPNENDKLDADLVRAKLRTARRKVRFERDGELISFEKRQAFIESLFRRATLVEALPEPELSENVVPEHEKWTDEEVENLRLKYTTCSEPLFIVQYKNVYSVLRKTGFSNWLTESGVIPFTRAEIRGAPIKLFVKKRNERSLISTKDFVFKHGRVANSARLSLLGHSRFEHETSTFVEVYRPVREIKAVYHADVEEFLNNYCLKSENTLRLKVWLANFSKLHKPSNVLVLQGPKKTGKTMMGMALSRYWGNVAPSAPSAYFSNFHDGLLNCPFILADEGLESTSSKKLRSMATAQIHSINRKGIPAMDLEGYIRMMITSNEDSISFKDDKLTVESIEAIQARFFIVDVNPDIAFMITENGGKNWTDELVSGDRFIEHIEWLKQSLIVPYGLSSDDRFVVTNARSSHMHDEARINPHEDYCRLFYNLIISGKTTAGLAAWKEHNIFWWKNDKTGELELFAKAKLLEDATLWASVVEGQRKDRPNSSDAIRALKVLSSSKTSKTVTPYDSNKVERAWPILLRLLVRWVAQTGNNEHGFVDCLNKKAQELNAKLPEDLIQQDEPELGELRAI